VGRLSSIVDAAVVVRPFEFDALGSLAVTSTPAPRIVTTLDVARADSDPGASRWNDSGRRDAG
jgi:hypothetical protein